MEPTRPEFVPDPDADREEMEALQREIAVAATFDDDFGFDPDAVGISNAFDADAIDVTGDANQTRIGRSEEDASAVRTAPVVAGVDQAFLDDRAVSAIVAIRDGVVIERVHAVTPLSIPYIPGLLSFREGGSIVAAFEELSVEPDLVLFDGSGRIHFRQAGIATHLGVVFDLPSVGVAKSLLCGRPRAPVDGLDEGTRVVIEADGRVEDVRGEGAGDGAAIDGDARDEDAKSEGDADGAKGAVIGYAVQTRQYPSSRRVNPLYVSAGHRVSAESAATFTLALSAGYKLPEPIRLADRHVGDVRDALSGHD